MKEVEQVKKCVGDKAGKYATTKDRGDFKVTQGQIVVEQR